MPNSPEPPDSPEMGSSMPPGGPPPGANVGGAGAPPPQGGPANLPPQGAPVNQSAKALGVQAQVRDGIRKAIIPALEQMLSKVGMMSDEGEAIHKVLGTLAKQFGRSQEVNNEALQASMRQQMTRKPMPQGAPPQPPTGPVPAPQAGPA